MNQTNKTSPTVDLDCLARQLSDLKRTIMEEMSHQYPVGSRMVFWRSANQRNESFGTVVGHTISHWPEIRVRYDDSRHVVGLHVGYTKFHALPNAQLSHEEGGKEQR